MKTVDYYLPHMTNPKVDNQEIDRHNDTYKNNNLIWGHKNSYMQAQQQKVQKHFFSQNYNNSNCNNQL